MDLDRIGFGSFQKVAERVEAIHPFYSHSYHILFKKVATDMSHIRYSYEASSPHRFWGIAGKLERILDGYRSKVIPAAISKNHAQTQEFKNFCGSSFIRSKVKL